MVIGSVIRAVFGAIFGAAFGYIIGWLVKFFFPNFTNTLMNGLHGTTGISGISLPALLAAVGFIVGIISGIAHSLRKNWWDY
jgi:hypothetical protein